MMLTGDEIKKLRSLHLKKYREEAGLFIVEGDKMVEEALSSSFDVEAVYKAGEIGWKAMERISLLATPSPSLAVVRIPQAYLDTADSEPVPAAGLCLGLDSIRDPGNLGTIIRLADWFGINCIYCSRDTVELFNPKVVQATMGAIFRKKVVYCDLPQICKAFSAQGRKVCGTFLNGENLYSTPLEGDSLVIMGNEANGISTEVAACVSSRLTIPSFTPAGCPGAESLNVAIATAITVAEFRRKNSFSLSSLQ